MAKLAVAVFAVGAHSCSALKASAAQLLRYSTANCIGNPAILSTDVMNECTPFLIPAPASIYVYQTNDTVYTSYHFQGPRDCSGAGTKLGDFVVGSCESFDTYSQKRVWVEAPPTPAPPPPTPPALKASAAKLLRYSTADCTGSSTILSTDLINECTPFLIPAPASIYVNQTNDSVYTSYHFQGPQDCSGSGTKLGDFLVGTCESFDTYSQKRVWVEAPPPPLSTCQVPGVCGRAYQGCCVASKLTGHACACHLHNGTGKAGSTDCGRCGKKFVECCTAFELTGHGCGCSVANSAVAVV